ncbi:endospore coat-associated protein [Paenibacillus polymyxa]|uniref:YheC/YheD family endospore coat-associated protein n=1 Tax=Paenibacillus TaxID=44249 RepID=UPI000470D160|nr:MULTISPECIES: YheC/YheD family protein [Paenibacillus]APB71791.1 endospore coat-associated protein [Paenibacillus polymyxa]OMF51034.1 endospore coat-associated protein [Paenibacillus peoriae]QYK61258.1 Endospore coat-associated protein YheD [Paenibacillus sp. S25]WCM62897.1 YheC/YheD family protein [Paenibacillus polymyxa]
MNTRAEHKPVVAVLTVHDEGQFFKGNQRNFRDILETGTRMGYQVYIVTVRDLKLADETVKGYVYNKSLQTWEEQNFPPPQVIYNRIPNRNYELKTSVRTKLDEISHASGIELYNPGFFNKWELFKWLRTSETTRQLVPATKRLSNLSSLGKMLSAYPYLYLKPENGKAGKGIMILKFHPDHLMAYRLTIQHDKKSVTYRSVSLSRLWGRIRREAGNSPYIIQQGIDLATYQKKPFDLRILVQKNIRGSWSITGVGARLAGKGSITTHVPRGGSVEDPFKLLSSLFGPEDSTDLLNKVKSTAIQIARQIERASGLSHGEMSMDLGVDTLGTLWFFEANAKPMKFDEPEIRQKSLRRIFQYSSFLAGRMKS